MENNQFLKDIRNEYVEEFCGFEDEILQNLIRETHMTQLHPQMISSASQAAFINMLVKISDAKKILEIGTFCGYLSIAIARALPDNGKLITIEKNDEIEWLSRKYFKISQLENKITLIIDDALNIISNIDEEFDIVVIDGDKRQYLDYYNLVFPKLKIGGLILVDNVLWNNKIFDSIESNDYMTKGIIKFNEFVKNDVRVEKVILDIRDGLMILRKLK